MEEPINIIHLLLNLNKSIKWISIRAISKSKLSIELNYQLSVTGILRNTFDKFQQSLNLSMNCYYCRNILTFLIYNAPYSLRHISFDTIIWLLIDPLISFYKRSTNLGLIHWHYLLKACYEVASIHLIVGVWFAVM